MKNVLVIFGGASSEYEVSLRSSASVLRNINREKYNVYTLGITKDGRWLYYTGDIDSIENNSWSEKNAVSAIISPDKSEKSLLVFNDNGIEKIKIDIIFPVMHGKYGEDGTIQGVFEMAGIPYVGCTPLAGAMCMDKAITNTICDAAGIPQAKWVAFTKFELDNNKVDLKGAIDYLKFPIFVKPANAGSSVGITKAHNEEELEKALEIAFKEDRKVVLEETLVHLLLLGRVELVVGSLLWADDAYGALRSLHRVVEARVELLESLVESHHTHCGTQRCRRYRGDFRLALEERRESLGITLCEVALLLESNSG